MAMKGTYRPTTLKLASKHCPHAVTLYNQGVPVDRRGFGVGIAAHAFMQALTDAVQDTQVALTDDLFEMVTLEVGQRLIGTGRTFEGEQEPPLPADEVWEARQLVREWLEENPIYPARKVLTEVGLAVDGRGQKVEYSPGARLRLIADHLEWTVEKGEEDMVRVLVVRDYKSAWPTDETELDTVQMKAQALLAWKLFGEDVDVIRQEVVNLRKRRVYTRDIAFSMGGRELLQRWEYELAATMRGLDQQLQEDGTYQAHPGGGCITCPFISHCQAVKETVWEAAKVVESNQPLETMAVLWAIYSGQAADLGKKLREICEDRPPIRIADGEVGKLPRVERKVKADTPLRIAQEWQSSGGDTASLMKALTLGVNQIESVAKVLFDEKTERQEWVADMLDEHPTSYFGFRKVKE